MRIKNQFLNEESLAPYGFKKIVINATYGLAEFSLEEDECCAETLIDVNGELGVVMDTYSCDHARLNDAIYHLIKDGLVEL